MRSRALTPALCVLVVLLAPSPAAGQVELIATGASFTPIDAYRGRVIWSEPSPTGYQLVEHHAGMTRPLPVATGATLFGVDLGPDRHGRVVAVYSRCARAPSAVEPRGALLGCDLYHYDFKRARETPIRRANTKGDEVYPAIWKGRLAFARAHRFYWRWLAGRGPSRPLGKAHPGLSPAGIDLRGTLAAISFEDIIDGGELDLVRIGERTRTLESGATFGVSIGRRFVHWLALWGDRYNGYFIQLTRYDFRGHSKEMVAVPSLNLVRGFARDGRVSYYIDRLDPSCSYCPGPYGVYRATGLPL